MFSNASPETVGFSSNYDTETETQHTCCQTSPLDQEEKSEQSLEKTSSEIQTDVFNRKIESPVTYDEKELASFLNKVCPTVLQELDKVERTKAFSNYRVTEYDSEDEVTQLHVLSANHLPKLLHLRVSALAWNCTGGIIAVGFETAKHDSWCLHESAVYFYNLNKYKFDGCKPSRVISTSSCISALAMHPFEPAVVAAGTQGGDIHVWTLLSEGEEMGFNNTVSHSERVTKIEWVTIGSQLLLVTSSLDGYMFTFKVITAMRTVTLCDKFILNEDEKLLKAGVTAFGFSKQLGVFVAALEGGELLHCSTYGALETPHVPESTIVLKKPVLNSLGKELGPVTCIQFSPYVDNTFLTTHIENKFTIRSLSQSAPLHIFTDFDILGGCWSKSQANAVLVWGMSHKIVVYNSNNGRKFTELECEQLHSMPKQKRSAIVTAVINPKNDSLLALSGPGEKAFIWEIPKHFI